MMAPSNMAPSCFGDWCLGDLMVIEIACVVIITCFVSSLLVLGIRKLRDFK